MTIHAIEVLSGKLTIYPSGSLNDSIAAAAGPTAGDNGYSVGQIWVDEVANVAYVLVDVTAGVATWTSIGAGGGVPDASETVKGILELATQAETNAGTDDLRAVTPLKLQNKSGLVKYNTRTLSSNNNVNVFDQIFVNTGASIDLTLPNSSTLGDRIWFLNIGSGVFNVLQNAGQSIRVGTQISSVGAGGSISATARGDSFTLVCISANTDWQVVDLIGNLEVT